MRVQIDIFGNPVVENSLREKFGIIPFSVLDTKTMEWKSRKKKWLQLGIKGELGREEDLLGFNRVYSKNNPRLIERYTSIFDPVLSELMYDWFCVRNGSILDPFAGGSVRGVVAAYKGFSYKGIELRGEQVHSNIEQADEIFKVSQERHNLSWIEGDSDTILDDVNGHFDMIFTCPPYFDLEKYSDMDADISNMEFPSFVSRLTSILHKSVRKLKDNRFLVIVIGDVRDKDRTINWYRNLVGITKQIIIDTGMHLYNEIILLENIGTSAMRVDQAFTKRKLVKIHQNVLVFYKGVNVNDIRDEFGNI